MAEEVKAEQPAEQTAAPEGAKAEKKTTKINRMDAGKIASKIEELEKSNMTGSKYYKHLLQRKRELGL
jgi:hypothetical protein